MDEKTFKEIKKFCKNNRWRLGQFFWNAMNAAGAWESPEANRLFFINDADFEEILKSSLKLWK
jgi:hypothetical protein